MSTSAMPGHSLATPHPDLGSFQAKVDQHTFNVTSVLTRLTLRPELSKTPNQWVWKIIAEGKVNRLRTSIGLFFDQDLPPGHYNILGNPLVSFVCTQASRSKSVIYHSGHLQAGYLTLLEADINTRRLRGEFGFSISAVDFAVTDGAFDVLYQDG